MRAHLASSQATPAFPRTCKAAYYSDETGRAEKPQAYGPRRPVITLLAKMFTRRARGCSPNVDDRIYPHAHARDGTYEEQLHAGFQIVVSGAGLRTDRYRKCHRMLVTKSGVHVVRGDAYAR